MHAQKQTKLPASAVIWISFILISYVTGLPISLAVRISKAREEAQTLRPSVPAIYGKLWDDRILYRKGDVIITSEVGFSMFSIQQVTLSWQVLT
jgi:hypothetical protein